MSSNYKNSKKQSGKGSRNVSKEMHQFSSHRLQDAREDFLEELQETSPTKLKGIADSEDEPCSSTRKFRSQGISRKHQRIDSKSSQEETLTDSENETFSKKQHNTSDISRKRRRSQEETLTDSDSETFDEKQYSTFVTSRKHPLSQEETLTDSESELPAKKTEIDPINTKSFSDITGKGASIMAKMGYSGKGGLGISGQGRVETIPFSSQRGRIGLGHEAAKEVSYDWDMKWEDEGEVKNVEEKVDWLSASEDVRFDIARDICNDWIIVGEKKMTIDDEDRYCESRLLKDVLRAKTVFDHLTDRDLNYARMRANPFETIGSAFFQNRAALKMANMDRVFDWSLTKENEEKIELKRPLEATKKSDFFSGKNGRNTDRHLPLFYFADICAGPGGFSEYVLWRKGYYNAKGFGFTLRGKDDFKLERFCAASPEYFETFYGEYGDGDITKTKNIISLEKLVKKATNGAGLDLVMADGGFSVANEENIQEILSKRLYLCQFLAGISLLQLDNNSIFLCKLFDIFTPFSIGLIYLLNLAFRRISLHKPNSSRPANSERYIICEGLISDYVEPIKNHLIEVNSILQKLIDENRSNEDVQEIVPADVIESDPSFVNFIRNHNNSFLKRQILYLNKYLVFAKNVGKVDTDQGSLRANCLKYWKLPDLPKKRLNERHESLTSAVGRLFNQVIEFKNLKVSPEKFTISVVKSDNKDRIRFAELRMVSLSEKTRPKILVSIAAGSYLINPECTGGFERINLNVKIPKDTLLFVQITTVFSKISSIGLLEGKSVIRIIDASLIDGDFVGDLSYDERMKAAQKLCDAVAVTNSQAPTKFSPLFTAKVIALEDINMKFSVIHKDGQETAVIQEHNECYFYCRAMHVVSIFSASWVLCWSSKRKMPYAFDKTGKRPAVFSDKFDESHFTNFLMNINPKGSSEGCVYQWHWDWTKRLDSECGPKAILEDEQNDNVVTLRELKRTVRKQIEKAGVNDFEELKVLH